MSNVNIRKVKDAVTKEEFYPQTCIEAVVDENGQTLGIDASPTDDSDKLVRSGGVKAAIDGEASARAEAVSAEQERATQVEATKYEKPNSGIPKVDLASDVQASLELAQDVVYDISAHNNNTAYADLAAALGANGANIPQGLRKGGMSVKFVLSSDNKYVQYRLMKNTFSTTPADWQGVDDKPTPGSDNLATSGVVANVENKLRQNLYIPLYEKPFIHLINYELGNISIANTGWTYSPSNTRVRTPEGYVLHLFPGDIIGLSSYENARFFLGWRTPLGKYANQGWNTSDFTVQEEAYFCILVCNTTDTAQSSADALGSLVQVTRKTTVKGMFDVLDGIEYDADAVLVADNKIINNAGNLENYPGMQVYSISVHRGDYLCVYAYITNQLYAIIARDSATTDKYDAFIPAPPDAYSPVRYICEKDETLYVCVRQGYPYKITHIKNVQIRTLIDEYWYSPYADVTNIAENIGKYWIKYSDGTLNSTSSNIYVYKLPCVDFSKVRAFVSNGDTNPAAIAFYSGEISSANYIQANSVQIQKNEYGGRWYEASVPVNAKYVCFTNNTAKCGVPIFKVDVSAGLIRDVSVGSVSPAISVNTATSFFNGNAMRFGGPFYAHLFLDKASQGSTDVVIPSQSLADIRVSHRLGFKMIEANVQTTSDGKYVVIHGNGGKFGYEVTDTNGEYTYADTAISTVSLDWIKANIIYRSDIARYKTSIPTLEEFLNECRLCGMIPFVQASTQEMVDVIEGIMGKNNYIAYNGTRALTSAPIYVYISNLTTKSAILAKCREYGVPFIYGMGNFASFSDTDLKDVVNALHKEGYMIGAAYTNAASQQRLIKFGFDMIAAGNQVNDFNGNLCNLTADATFSDFTVTGGTVTPDGTVTLQAYTSVNPQIIETGNTLQTVFLGKESLRIVFSGTIHVEMGSYINSIHTSDTPTEIWVSTYFLNEIPGFKITTTSSATAIIYDIVFKVSKC